MAGALFGIPLSQNVDVNGRPLVGAMLFVYQAGTLTPASTFQDSGLSNIQPFPLVADASGRIPQFWVADGTYRARLTDANSILIYDQDGILAIGPSGGGGGGGGGGTVNGFTTGDTVWIPIDGTRTGFVRLNGRTIGSAASGATERANADTSALFGYLWNNFNNATCPVSGGRGGSATADFSSNKTITPFSMRGRAPFGLDTMGNTAAGIITGGTVAAATGGSQNQAILQTHFPNVNFAGSGLTVNAHTHGVGTYSVANHQHTQGSLAVGTSITNGTLVARNVSTTSRNDINDSSGQTCLQTFSQSQVTISLASGAVSGVTDLTQPALSGSSDIASANGITGTVPSGGSGTALPTISPYVLGTWLIAL